MKKFLVTDNKKIVGKVLKGLKLTDKRDDKMTLKKLKFSMNGYKNLDEKEILNLSSARLFSPNLQFLQKRKYNKLCKRLDA